MIVLEAELRGALGLLPNITDVQRVRCTLALLGGHAAVRTYIHYDPEQKAGIAEFYPRNELSAVESLDGTWDVSGGKAVFEGDTLLGRYLQLQRLPVRAVTDLRVDLDARSGQGAGDFASDTIWTVGEDYWVEWDQANVCLSGQLISDRGWPASIGKVRVVYRAGYSPIEFNGPAAESDTDGEDVITTQGIDASALKYGCLMACVAKFHTLSSWAVNSITGSLTTGPLQSERMGDYNYTLANPQASSLVAGMANTLPNEIKEYLEPFVNYGILVG